MNIKSEYIKRKALLKKAKELAGGSFSTPLIISAIENAPKADVVEVVRCKDCKHYRTCREKGTCTYLLCFVKEDGFCSCGVRKEGAEE
jgi:hypothetical protein